MANLAIKGHPTRRNEVIEILEMLGGKNENVYNGTDSHWVYIIDEEGFIDWNYPLDSYNIFTLEEFLEKFPYKTGDKVYNIIHNENQTITDLVWQENEVFYQTDNNEYVYVNYLQPYKEETMEKEISGAIIDRFICLEGYDFYDDKGNIIDTKEITMKKKQPQYPKTFIEVLNFWHPNRQLEDDYQRCYKKDLIEKFQDLLYARDDYWKIAGEQMGMDKPWEPVFTNDKPKYCIYVDENVIECDIVVCINTILSFPTEEMRDAFYENFKELIEECKELL